MFDWLNWKMIEGATRNFAQWAAGALVTAGVIREDQSALLVGLIIAAVAFAWSMIQARLAKKAETVKKAVELAPPETKQSIDDVLKDIMNKPKGLAGTK